MNYVKDRNRFFTKYTRLNVSEKATLIFIIHYLFSSVSLHLFIHLFIFNLSAFSEECAMMVRILYKNVQIQECHVTGPEGCMIASNPITAREGQILEEAGLGVIKDAVS